MRKWVRPPIVLAGLVTGPKRGVVEDIADLREEWLKERQRAEKAETRSADLEMQFKSDMETTLRLLETIRYLIGIAERGEGREIRGDETAEKFVLGYVKKIEAENAVLRVDAERYRWFRSKRLWDADSFPWPVYFEYPELCLWDDGEMLDAAIDAVRKV